jgi:hypothetical protein
MRSPRGLRGRDLTVVVAVLTFVQAVAAIPVIIPVIEVWFGQK